MGDGDGRERAVARGVLGWLVLGVGIGLAIGVAEAVQRWLSLGTTAAMLLQAVLATAFVVPAIVLLRTRVDRQSLGGLGFGRPAGPPIRPGLGVGLGIGALVSGPALLAGWVEIGTVDVRELVSVPGPEHRRAAAVRGAPGGAGAAWLHVDDDPRRLAGRAPRRCSPPHCSRCTSAVISGAWWASATLLGSAPTAPTVFPVGSDPVEYVVQLVVFGLVLVAARRIPMRGALLIAIAFHVGQLTVNRLVLGGTGWLSTGVDVTLAEPDVILLVLVHLAVSGLVFVLIRRRAERGRPTPTREALASQEGSRKQ